MIKLYDNGVYLLNGTDIVEDNGQAEAQIQNEQRHAESHHDHRNKH